MKTVLITGFEPFGGEQVNPSGKWSRVSTMLSSPDVAWWRASCLVCLASRSVC